MDTDRQCTNNVGMTMDRHSRIALVVIGSAAVILIGVAVVVAVQPPREFDPGTPERTAQAYYQALLDGDEDLALSYLDEELLTGCPRHELGYVTPDSARVVIAKTEIDGDGASVDVVITETWGEDPFGGGSNTFDETLIMTRSGATWLISRMPWPVGLVCQERG
jgi:hypothetical protein